MYVNLEITLMSFLVIFVFMSFYQIKNFNHKISKLLETFIKSKKIEKDFEDYLVYLLKEQNKRLDNIDDMLDACGEDLSNFSLDFKDYLFNNSQSKEDYSHKRNWEQESAEEDFEEIPEEADEIENDDIDFEVEEENDGYSKTEDTFVDTDDTDDIEEVKNESVKDETDKSTDIETTSNTEKEEDNYDEIEDIIGLIQQAKSLEELLDLKQFYISRGPTYQKVVDFIDNKLELDF